MDKLRVLDTFAGIGGFSLGLERTGGFETAAFCEIEPFCQRVLNKHWPDVPIYDDIRELSRERLESDGIQGIDVVTGGFPCQDLSVAGKQAGIKGERSGLWSELCRVIGDIRPRYAIMENVTALISGDSGRWFGRVLGDLAEIGYDAEWHCIPASELGAHHHRDRVWIIAYPAQLQCDGGKNNSRVGVAGGAVPESRDGSGSAALADSHNNGSPAPEKREGITQRGDSNAQRKVEAIKSAGLRSAGSNEDVADTDNKRLQGSAKPRVFRGGRTQWDELAAGQFCRFGSLGAIEPTIRRGADGIPDRAHRLKALGNAVVPQIPELIGRAILEAEWTT